ncbi:dihydroxyacetone kinase subunit DhaL [Consotaella salsifontis]|uniref:Dihydroxyacetone kinase DhaL subunit n=1 Tax=Consotaella salsifontis TaxID=1365950 RepID=A0A1T4TEG0_9HYPH|nr:dihydroxyacetone kinase subunit DhaL [Consotaella salsifontis]SKA38836.1 dihydroxyacetone kinase DhaL subunit [Consotaella salsifontis]
MRTTLSAADFVAMFHLVADRIEEEKVRLSELDGVIGDGDHGITMAIGWNAVREILTPELEEKSITDVCNLVARTFLNAVGASSGPLYATALMRGGAALKGREGADGAALAGFLAAALQGLRDRGKAEPGDKTMIDAWTPAATAAAAAAEAGALPAEVLRAAAEAAGKGADATAAMLPKKGRSAKLGERALGHVDPGAASAAVILAAMADGAARP